MDPQTSDRVKSVLNCPTALRTPRYRVGLAGGGDVPNDVTVGPCRTCGRERLGTTETGAVSEDDTPLRSDRTPLPLHDASYISSARLPKSVAAVAGLTVRSTISPGLAGTEKNSDKILAGQGAGLIHGDGSTRPKGFLAHVATVHSQCDSEWGNLAMCPPARGREITARDCPGGLIWSMPLGAVRAQRRASVMS